MRIRSVKELAEKVAQDPQLAAKIQANPITALADLAAIPDDVWIYRIVVVALSLTVLITLIGAFYLTSKEMALPEGILALGSAAIGALAGLLAPSPAGK
jgi:hypothetical protein